MPDYKVLIVGYGVVGKNLFKELSGLHPDINDNHIKKDYLLREYDALAPFIYPPAKYDLAFICVDTPLSEDNVNLDISEVENAINENNAEIYVVKSTCPINAVDYLSNKTGKRIVYSPEYYGATQHCNNFNYDFVILGGKKEDCIAVQHILQYCYDARKTFHIVDSKTAELSKFMENAWLATKVTFCSQFYEIAKAHGISYEDLRELFILDPRVNPSHTFIYPEHPYWESHCLDKDVQHIAWSEDRAVFLKDVIVYNKEQKDRYKS